MKAIIYSGECFSIPTFIFGQPTASTTSCARVLLDTQGRNIYSLPSKKGLLITESGKKQKERRILMICNSFKGRWMILAFALAIWCTGCSGSYDSTTSEQGDDFHHTPPEDVPARIEDLKRLLPVETYNTITAKSSENLDCRERNRDEFVPPLSELPNGQWYYTYDNLIRGMAQLEEFANEGDENTRKLEIAAFLANIAQETGAKVAGDPFGSPGCAIQEGYGASRGNCVYGGCTKTRDFPCNEDTGYKCPDGEAGYCGRGPHQLSWDYNYKKFGEAMGVGDDYLNDPDILTKEPEIGIAGSIWFWGHEARTDWSPPDIPFKPSAHNVLIGNWKPTDKDVACGRTKANFGVIINIINGGIECGKGEATQQAKDRVKYLEAIAEVMGVTIPEGFLDDDYCSSQQNFSECPSY